MQYSFVDGVRRHPSPKARGVCQLCGREMLAKCGSQIVWHWAHYRSLNCDPWWEGETEWHLGWKARFPEEWREVVKHDRSANERHIADVVTSRGLVIELQNSPMPEGELKAREAFYGRMIWIVNAQSFAGSFHIGLALPRPDCSLSSEVVIVPRYSRVDAVAFWWRKNWDTAPTLVEPERLTRIKDSIPGLYAGDHLFRWVRPRRVWLNATCPVFLDIGGDDLLWLRAHPSVGSHCVRLVSRQDLIRKNGGDPGPGPYHSTSRGPAVAG